MANNASCSGELSNGQNIPTLSNCPAPNELLLFIGAAGAYGGYAFRSWQTLIGCLQPAILAALSFEFLDFVIGQIGSPMVPGQTVLSIIPTAPLQIIPDSINVVLNGIVLPRNDASQISYSVVYTSGTAIITLNQGAITGQTYVITYSYIT